mgnify:CR=1 FL=1
MNAPTPAAHLAIAQRDVPAAFLAALQARFGQNCSTAQVIREQHGRDESPFDVPPPDAVLFCQSTEDVAEAVLYMAGLPLDVNVQFMTVMATKMPFVGRG